MTEATEHLVVALDGSEASVILPRGVASGRRTEAPAWLVRRMGLTLTPGARWWLVPLAPSPGRARTEREALPQAPRKLCLVRAATACAGGAPFDPRQARLRKERIGLEKLNEESDHVRVEPLDVLDGSEPERYRITFLCRGIIGVDGAQNPLYDDRHQVEITCGDDFPADVPSLRWVTPIWHPNIQHKGAKGVCVNKPEWLGGMGLDDLCRMMFEMVQYKNYHAEPVLPGPLDHEVAKWVLEYGEPRNIVNKRRGIFVDDKPFTRPTVTRFINVVPPVAAAPPATATPSRIKVVGSQPTAAGSPPTEAGTRPGNIKILGTTRRDIATESSGSPPRIKVIRSE